jgi:hypothetical protein
MVISLAETRLAINKNIIRFKFRALIAINPS